MLEVSPGPSGDDTSIAQDLYADSEGDGQIVLWTDPAGRDINLAGVRGAEELVATARDLVCD